MDAVIQSWQSPDSHISDPMVFLHPRPYAKHGGKLILLPLLPHRPPAKSLPSEVWSKIIGYAFAEYSASNQDRRPSLDVISLRQGLLLVCKTLKDVALPLYYALVEIKSIRSLEKFTELLHAADQKWDSIRRIPYSAPGRWVQVLDLSGLHCTLWSDVCHIDGLLTKLVPLMPFLIHLELNPTITLSRRILGSLSNREGVHRLTSLRGLKIVSSVNVSSDDDTFVELLRQCRNLEELSFTGSGIETLLLEEPVHTSREIIGKPLQLPRLSRLSMISVHCSPVVAALLYSPLPALAHLTVTPYDDISIPTSLIPRFVERHGPAITSLHLYAPKSWPTMLFPSPTTLLHTCPKLHHLSLENPLPMLTICSIYPKHPLQILSIPRPNPEFLTILESLLPKLPALRAVRARDVKWLRAGMNEHAREAGVQGEMREWRRRLARRGVQVLDATWRPSLG